MKRILLHCLLGIALFPTTSLAADGAPDGMPDGQGSYEDLVALFDEFHQWRDADFAYDAAAVAARLTEMAKFQERLADMAVVEVGARRSRSTTSPCGRGSTRLNFGCGSHGHGLATRASTPTRC